MLLTLGEEKVQVCSQCFLGYPVSLVPVSSGATFFPRQQHHNTCLHVCCSQTWPTHTLQCAQVQHTRGSGGRSTTRRNNTPSKRYGYFGTPSHCTVTRACTHTLTSYMHSLRVVLCICMMCSPSACSCVRYASPVRVFVCVRVRVRVQCLSTTGVACGTNATFLTS